MSHGWWIVFRGLKDCASNGFACCCLVFVFCDACDLG